MTSFACMGFRDHAFMLILPMHIKFSISIALFLLNCSQMASANIVSSQLPVAAHWCLPDVSGCTGPQLLSWNEKSEINAYYQQHTPIAALYTPHPVTQSSIIPFLGYSTSQTPAEMSLSSAPQVLLTQWNYMRRITYFGGSLSEGQVVAPSPGMIKAAHEHGIRILGTLFFSPTAYGGDKEQQALDQMLGISKPYMGAKIATSMCHIAQTLGFDGYFINEETDESDTTLQYFPKFINQLKQCSVNNKPLIVDWYQVPAINIYTPIFMQGSQQVASDAFLDYSWQYAGNTDAEAVENLEAQADAVHYPITDLDFGIDASASPTPQDQTTLLNVVLSTKHAAISEFSFKSILTDNQSHFSYSSLLKNENNFWRVAGSRLNLSSAVTRLPFSTFFNTGQGQRFFISGKMIMQHAWSDMAQQDLLPTWRVISTADQGGNQLHMSFDYNDAYDGGSSLVIAGKLVKGGVTNIPLYLCDLHLSNNTQNYIAELASKISALKAATIQLVLVTADGKIHGFPIDSNTTWQRNTNYLDSISDDTIRKIGLRITALKTVNDFSYELGNIFIGSKNDELPPVAPAHLNVAKNSQNGTYVVRWQPTPDARNYDIYAGNQFVGRTSQLIFAVPDAAQNLLPIFSVTAINPVGIPSQQRSSVVARN